MNVVIMKGRLTKDPDLRFIAGSGKAVCNFDLAVDRPFAKEKTADFFKIQVWSKAAEACANYLAKGRECIVKGYIQNRKYENAEGQNRYVTEIVADQVEFIGGRKDSATADGNGFVNDFNGDGFQQIDDDENLDIPF